MRGAEHGPFRTLLAAPLVLSALAGVCCILGGGLAGGASAALSAGVAATGVLVFLLLGQVPVDQASRGRTWTGGTLLVGLYVLRVLVGVVAVGAVAGGGPPGTDRRMLGLTVVVCGLAWTAGAVWSAVRWRPMVVVPETRESPPATAAGSDR